MQAELLHEQRRELDKAARLRYSEPDILFLKLFESHAIGRISKSALLEHIKQKGRKYILQIQQIQIYYNFIEQLIF